MRLLWLALLLVIALINPATAQLALPGAVTAPTIQGKPARALGPDGQPLKRAKPVSSKVPGEDAIIGLDLSQNGAHGRMVFARSGEGLDITALTLEGTQISRPDDICRVDLALAAPVTAKPVGRPAGALRFQMELALCPLSFDILEGAVLVGPLPQFCQFDAADCKTDPAGLWGPRGASFTPERIKELERSRTHSETLMRENFRELLARTHGKAAVKATAGDQAGFTSIRAQVCRDYAREDVHGFCALRLTDARAMALKVMLGQASDDNAGIKEEKKRRKNRGAVPL